MNKKCFLGIIILLTSYFCFGFAAQAENSDLNKKLYEAVLFQDTIKIKTLLSSGANPDYKENGRPLLGWAAQNGNVEVVQLLINAKADVNIPDEGIGHSPLMRAIDTQQVAVVKVLLNAKANPNAKNTEGKTCLDMAVESRKPEVVSALIEAGADVKYVSPEGDSPALIAALDGMPASIEIIKILGKAGANLNASNPAYTALSYAIEQGNKELVQTLLEAGADSNARTEGGQVPVLLAVDKKEILELLLKAKANPDVEGSYGTTALFAAIEAGNKDSVELLLKAGADANKVNSSGTSPLEYANQYSQTEIAAVLSAHLTRMKPSQPKELVQIPAS